MKSTSLLLSAVFSLCAPALRAQGPVTVYNAQGVLTAYDAGGNVATVDCDAIPGYTPAKTISLGVRDVADFNHFMPGDILRFQLDVSGGSSWIAQAAKIGISGDGARYFIPVLKAEAAERRQKLAPHSFPVAIRELSPGDAAPDIALTDQAGHPFHLSDLKGNAVAITFIYTSCSMPSFCPMMSQNFARTQDLMARLGSGDNWRLLSITIDPAHDSPKVLSAYAAAWNADPAHWTFATGENDEIGKFGAALGLQYQQSGQTITHNLCAAVIDPAGRLHSIHTGNGWTPQDVASELSAALGIR